MYATVSRIAATAAIALAALPIVAVGAAHAETRAPAAISKVDFSRAENVVAFNGRVAALQRQFCSNGQKRSVADADACREAVRAEIMSQLSAPQRMALTAAAPRG